MSGRNRRPLLTEQRLKAEIAVMARAYPGFRWFERGSDRGFVGRITSNYGSTFRVEVRLPRRFPEVEPHLWIVSPRLPDETAHRYNTGRLCAHAEPFIPFRTTAAAMVSVAAGWIFRFERHRLQTVSWDTPLGGGAQTIRVRTDGTLTLTGR